MNYAPGVLAYLSQADSSGEVYLASGIRPVQRTGETMRTIGETVMTPDDIRETLSFLHSHAPAGKMGIENEGLFSFGIPKRGRFRVSFITQRGSYVVRIVKIPMEVPSPESLIDDRAVANRVVSAFSGFRRGVLLISGSPLATINALVYGLVEGMVVKEQKVVVLIEHDTTYLLRHGKSIVVQCEYGPDNETIENTLRSAMMIAPDMIYVHDLSARADLDMVIKAAKSRVMVLAAISGLDTDRLFPGGKWLDDPELLCGWWNAEASPQAGKLRLDMDYGTRGNLT
jgi:twitching motility protein PilT